MKRCISILSFLINGDPLSFEKNKCFNLPLLRGEMDLGSSQHLASSLAHPTAKTPVLHSRYTQHSPHTGVKIDTKGQIVTEMAHDPLRSPQAWSLLRFKSLTHDQPVNTLEAFSSSFDLLFYLIRGLFLLLSLSLSLSVQ
jgi:hypothetical protein